MIAVFLKVAREVKKYGGTVSFEWPQHATGWSQPLVRQLISELGLQTVNVDGCAVGVRARTGEPMLKPWRIETDCARLASRLEKFRCKRDHVHRAQAARRK